MSSDSKPPLDGFFPKQRTLDELLGGPSETPEPTKYDSSYLIVAAETDGFTERVVGLLLGALRNRKSAKCRESAVWLCECAEIPSLTHHVIKAMKREHRLSGRCKKYLYVNYFLAVGEPMLEPMLAIWDAPESDAYSKSVSEDYLTRFLSKPLTDR